MSVSWTEEPIPVPTPGAFNASEAITQATLKMVRALARPAPAAFGLPCREAEESAEALRRAQAAADPFAAYLATLPAEPPAARCDACGREADLDEMIQGRDCTIFCQDCRDARTDDGWSPEEWGFDGEGEGDA